MASNIHEMMRESFDLAVTFAQDGAFHTASDILRELADTVKQHAVFCDKTAKVLMAEWNAKNADGAAILSNLIALVDEKIAKAEAAAGEFNHADYTAWRQRRDAADAELIAFFTNEHGACFSEKPPHDHAVRMAGIRSTSTSGYHSALRNWQTAARKKLAGAA